MEMRRRFTDGDLNYLANLCHACGTCYDDCQFAPPHEFDVNVPRTLARVRADSYRHYAWPGALSGLFARNGLAVALIAAFSVAAFLLGFMAWHDSEVVFGVHDGPGSFYRLMPHNAMIALFGAAFLFAIAALVLGIRRFWRDIGDPPPGGNGTLRQALHNAMRLRYLDGGGVGCATLDQKAPDRRRLFHHLTFYGFLLCFASTSVATLYHYLLDREAPYPWYDLPVVLGIIGGIGLVIGPLGLIGEKHKRDPMLSDTSRTSMDAAFLLMLLLTGVTGLALLVLRETPAMGTLLAVHLGVVFGLFVTLPYGKFVHGLYRFAALLRYARECRD
jgi:citrate/tricarballylate utilization protein